MRKIVLIVLGALAMVTVVVAAIVYFFVYPRVVKRIQGLVQQNIHRLAVKTGRVVKADEVSFADNRLLIRNLVIMDKSAKHPIFSIKKITLQVKPVQVLKNRPIGPLVISGASLKLTLHNHRPEDLIDLWHRMNKTGVRKGHKGSRIIRKARGMRLIGIKIDGLGIEVKEQEHPDHVLSLGDIHGQVDRVHGDMSGALNGYLWVSQGGATRIHAQYSHKQLSIKLASRITLPAWLFAGADTLSFQDVVLGFGKGIKFAIRSVKAEGDTLRMMLPRRARKHVKSLSLQADEIGVGTRVMPLYPLKAWTKGLNMQMRVLVKGKVLNLGVSGADGRTSLDNRGYSLGITGMLSVNGGHGGPFKAHLVGDPVYPLQQVSLDTKGRVVPAGLAVIDPRTIVLPGSTGMVHMELTNTMNGAWTFKGKARLKDIGYFSTRVCLSPVFGISAGTNIEGMFTRDRRHFMLNVRSLTLNGIRMSGTFEYNKAANRPARMQLVFDVPTQDCGHIVDSIPKVMIPRLYDMRATGPLSVHIKISTDLKDIFARTRFDARIDVDKCKVLTLGSIVNLDMLNQPFVLKRPDPDKKGKFILVGPGTDNYVPIEKIPVWVQQAALATEDMAFFSHHGFKPGLIRRAIALDLDKGWYVYGGSTITQQLVKNLFLSTEKSLSRKLEEAIITWQVEKNFPKEKILELYLNCIEYGKGVYGIKQAAKVYFNKDVNQLTPLQAAWIMATKPSPKYAFRVYKRGVFNEWWVNRMRNILLRLWKEMHVIDERTFLNAAPYLPAFYYADKGIYLKPKIKGKFQVPQGVPKELPDLDIEHELMRDIRGVAPPIINIRRIESWW